VDHRHAVDRASAEEIRVHPAYVSFLSALNAHGIIDQIPAR
jgi:predicted transcriptional regulator of viral defense system